MGLTKMVRFTYNLRTKKKNEFFFFFFAQMVTFGFNHLVQANLPHSNLIEERNEKDSYTSSLIYIESIKDLILTIFYKNYVTIVILSFGLSFDIHFTLKFSVKGSLTLTGRLKKRSLIVKDTISLCI